MSKYHFYLKSTKARTSAINLVVRYSGNTVTFFTREEVPVEFWDSNTQRPVDVKAFPEYGELCTRLDNIMLTAKNLFRKYQNDHDNVEPSPIEYKRLLEATFRKVNKGFPQSLIPFAEYFIAKMGKQMISEGYSEYAAKRRALNYQQTVKALKDFAADKNKRLDFDTIDHEFYADWIGYMETIKVVRNPDGSKTRMYGFSANNIGKHIKNLKRILNEASSPEIAVNKNMYFRRFKILREDTESIYLSEHELEAIYNLDLSHTPKLEAVRDLFLVGCWTGLRFSDFVNIQAKDIKGDMLHIRTQKTGAAVVIPIHWMIAGIMQRYPERENHLPPPVSNSKLNAGLKYIGNDLDCLQHPVEITMTKAGKRITMRRPKCELLTTHTARRSFATNMYNAGVPTLTIMAITGHRTEGAFLRYIKTTPDEHANILKGYFKGPKLKAV